MKMIALTLVGLLAGVVLSSCGECDCHSYNKDYLRDVPTTSSQYFD